MPGTQARSLATALPTATEPEAGGDGGHVLGIAGSLRQASFNRALLEAAKGLMAGGGELRIYPGLAAIPPFNEDEEEPAPAAVAELREAIRRAEGVLFASPEYNHSIPGVLKNAVDWASRPYGDSALRGKTVAVIGASTGRFGAAWAGQELRKVLKAAGGEVLDVELAVGQAHRLFDDAGRLTDDELRDRLRDVVRRLAPVPETPRIPCDALAEGRSGL